MTNDLSVADDAGDLKTFPPDMFRLVLAFLPVAGGRPSADGGREVGGRGGGHGGGSGYRRAVRVGQGVLTSHSAGQAIMTIAQRRPRRPRSAETVP